MTEDARQAKDPATSHERLQQLSTHKNANIRRAAAQNPNTPIDALVLLGREFPREFWSNPSLPLVLLENPNLFAEIPAETAERLLNKRDLPGKILEDFAKNSDHHVQERVARNPNTPPSSLALLAKNPSRFVRREVAQNPNTPPEILTALASSTDFAQIDRVAKNASTPMETRWRLFTDVGSRPSISDVFPREWLSLLDSLGFDRLHEPGALDFKERGLSPAQRALLLSGGRPARHLALTDIGCPLEVLFEVAREPRRELADQQTIALILLHPKATPALREEIASSPEEEKRAALASSHKTPEELLRRLSQDPSESVLCFVAQNPNTPQDCLRQLSSCSSDFVRAQLAGNPGATDELLCSLPSLPMIDRAFSVRPMCPEEVWARLAKSSDDYILQRLAQNEGLPASVCHLLFQNQRITPHLRLLISNPAVPLSLLESIKSQESLFERAARSTSREDLQRMIMGFSEWRVRLALASSAQAVPDVLAALSKDQTRSVREAALKNPNTPKQRAKRRSK